MNKNINIVFIARITERKKIRVEAANCREQKH